MLRVLFVCMGNICRSPTAEGVARALAGRTGLGHLFEFDSAGTHDYHVGDPPDQRALTAAARRGYDLSALRARQVADADFTRFDLILAMDRDNLDLLRDRCPAEHRHKLGLLLEHAAAHDTDEVPDPYYGGGEGFERVLDLVEDAARGLLRQVTSADAPPLRVYEKIIAIRTDDVYGGHVNYARYFHFVGLTFAGWYAAMGLDVGATAPGQPLMAHQSLDFKREMHYPGSVLCRLIVTRLGRSSLEHRIELRDERDLGNLHAEGRAINVWFDHGSGTAAPWPAEYAGKCWSGPVMS